MAGQIRKQVVAVLADGRQISGDLLAQDEHMNVVLANAKETRTNRKGAVHERDLKTIILRGNAVISLSS